MVNNKLSILISLCVSGLLFCLLLPFAAPASAPLEITIAWDPNTDEELAGYGIYVKNSPDEPFRLLDDLYLDELEDPQNPMVTLTQLEEGFTYYFSVTAFGKDGQESYYSKSVCAQVNEASISRCSSGSSGGGGGGGGGGGCFITSASGNWKTLNSR